MRTPRRLVAALAATALGWGTLSLVVAAPAQADVQPPLRADGTAAVTWTPGRAGPLNLVATYTGDIRYDPATSAPAPVTVAKPAATLTFSGKLKRGQAGKVKVAVRTVSGVAATGKITIKVGTKPFTKTLKNGVATFKIGQVPAKGKLKVKAKYTGDPQYAAGAGKFKFTLT